MATGLIMVTILQCIQMSSHYTVHLPETKIVCPVYFSKNKWTKKPRIPFLTYQIGKNPKFANIYWRTLSNAILKQSYEKVISKINPNFSKLIVSILFLSQHFFLYAQIYACLMPGNFLPLVSYFSYLQICLIISTTWIFQQTLQCN